MKIFSVRLLGLSFGLGRNFKVPFNLSVARASLIMGSLMAPDIYAKIKIKRVMASAKFIMIPDQNFSSHNYHNYSAMAFETEFFDFMAHMVNTTQTRFVYIFRNVTNPPATKGIFGVITEEFATMPTFLIDWRQ